ncbi:MAG: CYTH domain-containing protein [Lachnospiraceae bacterium]|nr:CYTH domain-containing protein [Lachnospiraceae bacterium]
MEFREIERKWLVKSVPEDLERYECLEIEQAYLNASPTVRVRRENNTCYLTYKGAHDMPGNSDLSHTEYNLPLDGTAYEHLKEKRDGILLHKKRYVIPISNGLKIELDVFEGELAPLVLAEVEFPSEEEALAFTAPDWFALDVTEDVRYKNSTLSLKGAPSAPVC